jgi:2-oxoglutarate ferredoxin oxidoreductase subunit gamma
MYEGYEIAQTQSYGPEARGGACRAELVISDAPIDYAKADRVDCFVAFNEAGFKKYCTNLHEGTVIFADSTLLSPALLAGYQNVHAIEATRIAQEKFKPFAANIVMLGFMAAKLGHPSLESIEKALAHAVPEKALEVNRNALLCGYERGK